MIEQERFEFDEVSLRKDITELEWKVKEYRKRAEYSKAQGFAKQYQDQCDAVVNAFEGLLAELLAIEGLVKQGKAKQI